MYIKDMHVSDRTLIEEVRIAIAIGPHPEYRWEHDYNLTTIRDILIYEHPEVQDRLQIENGNNLVLRCAPPANQ